MAEKPAYYMNRDYELHGSYVDDERRRVASRQQFGAPKATAASVTGAPIGKTGADAQEAYASRLRLALSGDGPTASTTQLGQATADAKRAMYASAFSRPNARGLARTLRTTGNEAARMDAAASGNAEILRAQDKQQALNQYGALASVMRGADMAEANEANKIAMANAGFRNQTDLANQQAWMQWQQLNDQQKRALAALDIDRAQSEFDSSLAYKGAMSDRDMRDNALRKQQAAYERSQLGQAVDTVGGIVGMGMLSDEREKTDIKPGEGKVREFLSALGAHDYRYRDPEVPGAAPGRHVSPMAQEIEKTEIGQSAVTTGPDGRKRVDYARLWPVILAGEADMHKRLTKLERGR